MAYAVEMYFDPATDQAVRSTWLKLAEAGLGRSLVAAGFRPHESLGVCDQLDQAEPLAKAIQLVFLASHPITLNLSSTGIFHSIEGVVFFGVTVTPRLLELHADFNRILVAYTQNPWEYYRPADGPRTAPWQASLSRRKLARQCRSSYKLSCRWPSECRKSELLK